jgi:hypothetical protein
VQVFRLPPAQDPPWHWSVCVQALPSSHVVPSGCVGFEHAPVLVLQTPAAWHWSSALHTVAAPPTQVPLWQVSPFVHALPSLHAVPSDLGGFEQMPLVVSQMPTLWHWSVAVQTTLLVPVQTPFWQLSLWVQALPSLQAVPLTAGGLEQEPDDGLQVPATWHWSLAEQVVGVPLTQAPAWQLSPIVHALLSEHVVPLVAIGFEHRPVLVSQVPATWHWSLALHTTGFEPVHTPVWQVLVR